MAYADKLVGNQPCANHPAYKAFFDENTCPKISVLIGNNKEKMEKLFGKWNGTFRSEFLHYIWELKRNGRTFYVFTGKKGTIFETWFRSDNIEAFQNNEVIGRDITELLAELYEKFSD